MELFINKSKGKFNNLFNYDNLNYISTKKPINLLCIKHNNFFEITTRNHLESHSGGCKMCDREFRLNIFINQSNKKFGNKYEIINNTYINSQNLVDINCKIHGVFKVKPQNHLSQLNGGCLMCIDGNDFKLLQIKSNNKFNNNFNLSKFNFITLHDNNKSIIKCLKHNNEFLITMKNHLNSKFGGCVSCKNEKNKIIKNKKIINIDNNLLKDDEEFKLLNLNNYENLYKISNYGRIYSIKKNIFMKNIKNGNGYNIIRLYNNLGKSKIFRIHQLVGLTFIDNIDNKPFIDHINRIRDDNYYKNLRWVTREENMKNITKIQQNKNNIKLKDNNEIKNDEKYININIINNYDLSNYKINEYGNIINTKTNNKIKFILNDNYHYVKLKDNISLKYINFRVNRLVAFVFIKKPDNYDDTFVVNHIDNNKLNNYYKNLEWCTQKENTTKYFEKKLVQLDKNTNAVINKFRTFTDAYKYLNKTYNSMISKCCKGDINEIYGYKWKIDE
jgi:hypothetical protein